MIGTLKQTYIAAKRGRLRSLARAIRTLFRSDAPYAPYRTINRIQHAFPLSLPWPARLCVPNGLERQAAERVRGLIVGGAYAQNVSEAILANAEPGRAAQVCLPPSQWRSWSDGRQPIARRRSLWLFGLFVVGRLLAAARDFKRLWRNASRGPAAPGAPYGVAMKVAPLSIASAATGGFLPWLLRDAPFKLRPRTIWVVPQASGAAAQVPDDGFRLVETPFPRLDRMTSQLGFACEAIALFAAAGIALLIGRWQLAVLLPDLIACRYLARVSDRALPLAFVFTLNDLADRPLWSWIAEQRGCDVPMVFYASSYSLFGYGIEPVRDIRSPTLLEGCWSTGWYQTERAARALRVWGDRTPDRRVVGAFDMSDDGSPLPQLPRRWIAVFDTEPVAQTVRLAERGYICPFVAEAIVVAFWDELGKLAGELDVVLVHKPKRPHAHVREARYRHVIARLQAEGRYVPLPTGFGPMRLVADAPASVILPFTSVGDIVSSAGGKAAYFDVFGTIRDAAIHANGVDVASGPEALRGWLIRALGDRPAQPKRTSA